MKYRRIKWWVVALVLLASLLVVGMAGCGGDSPTEQPQYVEYQDSVRAVMEITEVDSITNYLLLIGVWDNYVEGERLYYKAEYKDSTAFPEWTVLHSGFATNDTAGVYGYYNPNGQWFALYLTTWTEDRVSGDTIWRAGRDSLEWSLR